MLSALILSGCGGGGARRLSTEVTPVAYWNDVLLDSISHTSYGPPATSRAIGVVQTAVFDAWAAYDAVAVGTRLGGTLRRPEAERTDENKKIAISYAAYRTLLDLYPTEASNIRQKMVDLGYDPDDTSTDTSTPVGIGNTAANAVIAFRHTDGSNQLGNYADTSGYVPVNTVDTVVDPSRWQPLRFENGSAPGFIAPHWGQVTPFAVENPNDYLMGGPPAWGSSQYIAQLQEVIDYTANLNDRTKVIAEYWADGPRTVLPPGHWCIFAQYISQRDKHSIDDDAKMFFMLGNAELDAGIVCWNNKRTYDSARPITAIRHFFTGQTLVSFDHATRTMVPKDGSQWFPYQSPNFITPPFPEFTSGHSTFSAAGAEILRRWTRSDKFGYSVDFPANWSTFDPTVPSKPVRLSYKTFTDAANEAGISRLYGGIHIRAGNEEGLRCGTRVGEAVWSKAMTYIQGTAQ